MRRSQLRLLLLAVVIPLLASAFLVGAPSLFAQGETSAGVYKGWPVGADGRSFDSTLYLNADGSVLLVDDVLDGTAPDVRTGFWAPAAAGVVMTLTNDATGPLAQPLAVNLSATAEGTLFTAPGDTTLGERGRRFTPFAQIVAERNALPFSTDLAVATIASGGPAGTYKAVLPGGAGWQDVTLTLFPDFRATLERDALDGRAPSLSYGAWQDVAGQPAVTITEIDGNAYTTPVVLTLAPENGVLRMLTSTDNRAAELVGVPFYRLEGLANAVVVTGIETGAPAPTVVDPGMVTAPGAPLTETTLATDVVAAPVITEFVTATVPAQPAPAVVAVDYQPAFEAVPCPVDVQVDGVVTCGFLTVPENRTRAGSRSIRVFAVTMASLEEALPDPVLVLAGAPGESPLQVQRWFATAPIRETRNVIVVHPRGAGLSEPALTCPELADGADQQALAQSLANCYNRLVQEGVDPSGYAVDQMVADIADLLSVLEIEQVNLVGNDFGAMVARLVADRYPERVRTLVLESPRPVDANAALEAARNQYDALRKVFADCAADEECAAAYPDLEPRLIRLVEWYNVNPSPESIGFGDGDAILAQTILRQVDGGGEVPALVTALYEGDFGTACRIAPVAGGCLLPAGELPLGPASGYTLTVPLIANDAAPLTETMTVTESVTVTDTATVTDAGTAVDTPTVSEQSPQSWRDYFENPDDPQGVEAATLDRLQEQLGIATRAELTAFLDDLTVENFLPLLAATSIQPQPADVAAGAGFTIACSEDAPRFTIDDIGRMAQRMPPVVAGALTADAADLLALCPLWTVPPAAPGDRITALSMTPALVMGGTHDPFTPARWARRAAASLDDVFVRLFQGAGHNLLAPPEGCGQQVLAAFIDEPAVSPNLYCYRQQSAAFVLPD